MGDTLYAPHLILLISPPGGGKTDILNQLVMSGLHLNDLLVSHDVSKQLGDTPIRLEILPWLTQRPRRYVEQTLPPEREFQLAGIPLTQQGDKVFLPSDNLYQNKQLMDELGEKGELYLELTRSTAITQECSRLENISYCLLSSDMEQFDVPSSYLKIGILSLPPLKALEFGHKLEARLRHAVIDRIYQFTAYPFITKRLFSRSRRFDGSINHSINLALKQELEQEYTAFDSLIRKEQFIYVNNDPPREHENLSSEENLRIVRDEKNASFRRLKHIIATLLSYSIQKGNVSPLPRELRAFEVDQISQRLFGKPYPDLKDGDFLVPEEEGIDFLARLYYNRDRKNLREQDLMLRLARHTSAENRLPLHLYLDLRRQLASDEEGFLRIETYLRHLLPGYIEHRDHLNRKEEQELDEHHTFVVPGTVGRMLGGHLRTSEIAIKFGIRDGTTDAFFLDAPLLPANLDDASYMQHMLELLLEKKYLPYLANGEDVPLETVPWIIESDERHRFTRITRKSNLSVLYPLFMYLNQLAEQHIPGGVSRLEERVRLATFHLQSRAETWFNQHIPAKIEEHANPYDCIDSRSFAGIFAVRGSMLNNSNDGLIAATEYLLQSRKPYNHDHDLIMKWPAYTRAMFSPDQPECLSVQAYSLYLDLMERCIGLGKPVDDFLPYLTTYVDVLREVYASEHMIPMIIRFDKDGSPKAASSDPLYQGASIVKFLPEAMEQMLQIHALTGNELAKNLYIALTHHLETIFQHLRPFEDLPYFDNHTTSHTDAATTIHAAYVLALGAERFGMDRLEALERKAQGTLFKNLLTSQTDKACLKGVCVPGSTSEGLHDNLASIVGEYSLFRYLDLKSKKK